MIRNRQIAAVINEAANEILKNGSIPTNEEVTRLYNSKFIKEPGLPMVTPTPIRDFSVSDSAALNDIFTSIWKDLIIAYSENNSQAGKLLSLLNYYEVEKEKVMAQLDQQNSRIDALKKFKQVYINGQILGNRLDSFLYTDFDGNEEKGIPKTTCFVDLKQAKAYNWRKRTKVDITSATSSVKVTSPAYSSQELLGFNSCLYDTISEAWIHKVTSDKTTASVEVVITLPQEVEINSIVYTLLTTRPVSMHLFLSDDGSTFTQKADTLVTKKIAEWNFDRQKVKAIKIAITKAEPDGLNGTQYEYYFAAQNLSLYNDTYMDNGVLVTTPMTVKNIKSLTLLTKQMIYPKSSIRYFVCTDAEKVDWIEIEPEVSTVISQTGYTGNIRLMTIFYNYEHSPQLLEYLIIAEGDAT